MQAADGHISRRWPPTKPQDRFVQYARLPTSETLSSSPAPAADDGGPDRKHSSRTPACEMSHDHAWTHNSVVKHRSRLVAGLQVWIQCHMPVACGARAAPASTTPAWMSDIELSASEAPDACSKLVTACWRSAPTDRSTACMHCLTLEHVLWHKYTCWQCVSASSAHDGVLGSIKFLSSTQAKHQ